MEYLIKTPSFCYLQKYSNKKFRVSKKLTLNRSGFKKIEDYLINGVKSFFIENIIRRGFSLKEVSIIGSFEKICPLHIQLELTDQCNLNCDYCYQNASQDKISLLDSDKLYSFLLERKKEGLLEIGVTGGRGYPTPLFFWR